MRYILKNYQEAAVAKLAAQLAEAGEQYRATRNDARPHRSAVSLAAVTGAGKTVMAAATIESVLAGTPSTPADPSAVFLWVSDSPDLNKQSKHRIESALGYGSRIPTVTIGPDFREQKLSPGSLYFINTQLLTRTSTIARRHYMSVEEIERQRHLNPTLNLPVPDAGGYDFFQTLKRTLEDDSVTLYLIIDEAHRGMKRQTNAVEQRRTTIIQSLIQGSGDVPPVPVVWGISATPQRFNMFVTSSSAFYPKEEVTVDSLQVQESGLLKDTILLYIPEDEGKFDHELLAQGTRKLREMAAAWDAYVYAEDLPEPVVPLMVVQVPDKASDTLIDEYITTIRKADPSLPIEAFGHVFGDDRDVKAAGTVISKVPAERVQEMKGLRVLFAKEAVSTGWDCPRAEVLVSFRAARDHTHVTQLMGRMVRTPLARRVEGNEVLGSVSCILPRFDREVAMHVADQLARGGTGGSDTTSLTERRVLIDEEIVFPIEGEAGGIEEQLWECFESLPSEAVPSGYNDPIKRLTDLAIELSKDGLYPGAVKKTDTAMFKSMEAAALEYSDELERAIEDVENVSLREIRANLHTGQTKESDSTRIQASERSINVAMQEAERMFGPNLARGYVRWQADASGAAAGSMQQLFDVLHTARVKTAALARIPAAIERVFSRAEELARELLDTYRVQALSMRDSRSAVYRTIYEQSDAPVRIPMFKPWNRIIPSKSAMENLAGEVFKQAPLPRYDDHMLVWPVDRLFPAQLNEWEQYVLDVESRRPNFLKWFRNTGCADSSLNIAYPLEPIEIASGRHARQEIRWGRLRPDFIFFHDVNGEVCGSIIDPHGIHLADALPKLLGLCRFVEAYPGEYHRVESVAKVGGAFRVLDITDANVRSAIRDAARPEALDVFGASSPAEALFRNAAVSRKYL